ncbi:MAG: DUF5996 family protein [Pseudomonadota bacterium]
MSTLPPMPYADWSETKDTLHLFLQIIGKVRMKTHPKLNHWWHVTLYPHVRGLTTGRIPHGDGGFEVFYDMLDHQVRVSTNDGRDRSFVVSGLSVAAFYDALFSALRELDIDVTIVAVPYDNKSTIPFAEDTAARAYDADAVSAFWRALCGISSVFERYRSGFAGKQTPVQLYWHSFDLVVTRFSGREHPLESGRQSDIEAYSHEVISAGFWPGDDSFPEAAFYGYAYPEPAAIRDVELQPDSAFWAEKNGGALAILRYEDVRTAADPTAAILSFLNSLYDGATRAADWSLDDLIHRHV